MLIAEKMLSPPKMRKKETRTRINLKSINSNAIKKKKKKRSCEHTTINTKIRIFCF